MALMPQAEAKKAETERANLLQQARKQWPILSDLDIQFKENYGGGGGFLEFWPGDEEGTPEHPRPPEFAPNQIGVEVYDKATRPLDILGDIASHYLTKTNPITAQAYSDFEQSLTPQQKDILKEQYAHAKSEGEDRSFDQWYTTSGLPAMFRGYAFKQWPDEFNDKVYTPKQKAMFDNLMKYYSGQRGPLGAEFK